MKRTVILGGALTLLVAAGVGTYFVLRKPAKPGPVAVVVPTVSARQAVAVPPVRFTDITASSGIQFTHHTGATGNKYLPETMGAGVAVIDYDGDGKPDLFFVNSCPWPGADGPAPGTSKPCQALYRNTGDGTFEDVTESAGLLFSMYGVGAAVGDFDNDGRPDLFITGVGGDRLLRNIDGKRFEDVTAKAGVGGSGGWPASESGEQYKAHKAPLPFGTSATFVDYDGDGQLDLFVCRYATWSPQIDLSIKSTLIGIGRSYQQPTSLEGSQNALYRNKGNGTFEDVTESAGILVADSEGTGAEARRRGVGKSLGVVACDPDGDGYPDLFVGNDTVRNFFFANVPDGAGGRKYIERGVESNAAYPDGIPRGAMGIDAAEYATGKLAIAVANFANEPTTFLTVSNKKPLTFADRAAAVGLLGPSRGPLKFGTLFFDYDLDGRADLVTANGHIEPEIQKVQSSQAYAQPTMLFWNTGDRERVFEPVTPSAAGSDLFKPIVGRGIAVLDIDGDGDEDLVVTGNGGAPLILRNDQKLGHHWLRLKLVGDGKTVSRDGFGAEVTVTAGGRAIKRWLMAGRGYLGQSEQVVTVGLGDAASVESVVVRWPGAGYAKPESHGPLAVDRTHTLRLGERGAPAP